MTAPSAIAGDTRNIVLPSPKSLRIIGGIYTVPLNSTPPDATAEFTIPATATRLGFIADDGLSETEDRPTKSIYAWGSDQVAEPQETYSISLKFKLYEFLNPEVAKVAYGAENVEIEAATATHGRRLSIMQTSDVLDNHGWILDTFSPGGKRILKFYPLGRIIKRAEQKWSHKDVLAHDCEVKMFPDTNGKFSYTVTDDGILAS